MTTATLAACEKDGDDENIRSCIDLSAAELTFARLFLLARNSSPINNSFANIATGTCAQVDSIVGDTSAFPTNGSVSVFLTFPDTGCVDVDLRRKSGPLKIVFHGSLENIGDSAAVHLTDFEGGVGTTDGIAKMVRTTANSFDISFEDCHLTSTSGTMDYSGNTTITQLEGLATNGPLDDAYSYVGEWVCVDREGTPFNAQAITAVQLSNACSWNIFGQVNVDPEERGDQRMDFGNDLCDGEVVVYTSGSDQTIILP